MEQKINNTLAVLDDTLDLVYDLSKTKALTIIKQRLEESRLCLINILKDFNLSYNEMEPTPRSGNRTEKLSLIQKNITLLQEAVDNLCNNGGIITKRGTKEKANIAYDNILLANLWLSQELLVKEFFKREETKVVKEIKGIEKIEPTLLNRALNWMLSK